MSQPTLSRLENALSWRELARMGFSLIDLFCSSFKTVPERIVLDIDDTNDAVHGGQQLALFNAHYDDYCFQPIHIFEAATGKPVLSLLRLGKRPSGAEAADCRPYRIINLMAYTKCMKDKNKFSDITLDAVAQMVARGFTSLERRFDDLEERLEKIESRLEGAHNRIDVVADMVRPIEQLVPLIEKDFYNDNRIYAILTGTGYNYRLVFR